MEEVRVWKMVPTVDTYLSTGCKGGPEVQERPDGIEGLVLRDLACQASCIIEEL